MQGQIPRASLLLLKKLKEKKRNKKENNNNNKGKFLIFAVKYKEWR